MLPKERRYRCFLDIQGGHVALAAQPGMIGQREHLLITSTIAIGIEHTWEIAVEPLLQSAYLFRSPAIRGGQATRKTVAMKFELGCQYRVEPYRHSPPSQVERRRGADQHEPMTATLVLLDPCEHFGANQCQQSLGCILLCPVLQLAFSHGTERGGKKMRLCGTAVAKADMHADYPWRCANRAIDHACSADCVMYKITQTVGGADGAIEIEGGHHPFRLPGLIIGVVRWHCVLVPLCVFGHRMLPVWPNE